MSTKKAVKKSARKSGLSVKRVHDIYAVAAKLAWATTYTMKAKRASGAKKTEFLAKARQFRADAVKLRKAYKLPTVKAA